MKNWSTIAIRNFAREIEKGKRHLDSFDIAIIALLMGVIIGVGALLIYNWLVV